MVASVEQEVADLAAATAAAKEDGAISGAEAARASMMLSAYQDMARGMGRTNDPILLGVARRKIFAAVPILEQYLALHKKGVR